MKRHYDLFNFAAGNSCESSPCLNFGTCTGSVLSYRCTCDSGYRGVHCEEGKYKLTWLPGLLILRTTAYKIKRHIYIGINKKRYIYIYKVYRRQPIVLWGFIEI